jgi:branched-chain amino acid transport system ATP-binding protein
MSEESNSEPFLKVKDLVTGYGPTEVLHGISFEVPRGSIVTLIGANGAGKTTTLKSLFGMMNIKKGSITFKGNELVGVKPHKIAAIGLGFVPQERSIFPTLSVRENLEMGGYILNRKNLVDRIKYVTNFFPILQERISQQAGTLSGGERRMLAIGRALITEPELLVLDEPSLGLAPLIVDVVFERIKAIHSEGTTILVVEQNARRALNLADFGYVIKLGNLLFSGTGKELLENTDVQKAYLGAE